MRRQLCITNKFEIFLCWECSLKMELTSREDSRVKNKWVNLLCFVFVFKDIKENDSVEER